MRHKATLGLLALLMAAPAAAQTVVPCTGWVPSQIPSQDGPRKMEVTLTASVLATATNAYAVELCGAKNAVLKQVIWDSTDCTSGDLHVGDTESATTGLNVVRYKSDIGSTTDTQETFSGVLHYYWNSSQSVPVVTTETTEGSTTGRFVYVYVKNDNAGTRSISVKLVFGTE